MSRPYAATSDDPSTTGHSYWPAWLYSLVLHGMLLVILAIVLPSMKPAQPPATQRQVGIVLAQPVTERRFDYFEQPRRVEPSHEDATSPATARMTADVEAISAGLPSRADGAGITLPEIPLPAASPILGSSDALVIPGVRLDTGQRRPILPGLDDETILADEAARRAARQSLGPATRVSLFGSPAAAGRSFVFAIDRSKSMGGSGLNALQAAKMQLAQALQGLEPSHRFQVVAYHHSIVYYRGTRLIPATEENRAGVPAFIDRLAAFGGTGHETALRATLGMEPDVIFLLTDGADPHLNEIQLTNIRKLAEGRTTIQCIQFGWGLAEPAVRFLKQLADQNQGNYTYVDMSSFQAP